MAKQAKRGDEGDALRWRVVAIAVFVVALAAVLLTLDDPGLTWDEPFSIFAGGSYVQWLAELPRLPFGREAIDRCWSLNHEHPPLAKVAMGISRALLERTLGYVVASRFAVALAFALLVELVFCFASRAFGGLAGLMAAGSLLCMPRVFGHAHLAGLDLVMAFAWTLSAVVFARAVEEGGWRWSAVSGLCFGLALLTKINAVFLPLALVGWGVGFYRRRALAPLAWTLGGGVVVFLLGWPWLWPAPATRLWAYLHPTWRVAIPVWYFGRVYAEQGAPWHYPLVLTAATIPVGILFLVVLGAVGAVRQFRVAPLLALPLVHAAAAVGPFLLPWLPKYDGVRLFLPAFPFLAVLAGVGGARCWAWVAERSRARPRRALLVAVLFFLSQAGAYALIHPCELSYYNALVGGLWGAERLGLETTYWHDCVNPRLFAWLNRRCAMGDAVAFFPVGELVVSPRPQAPDLYDQLYLDTRKRLRAVRLDGGGRWHLLVLNARRGMLTRHPEAWRIFTTRRPVFAIKKQGVTLAAVYARE